MKVMPILLAATVSFVTLVCADEALPPDVQRVIDQRAAAVAKIDKVYLQELDKLKTKYTKQGNLDVANKLMELIRNQGGVLTNSLKPFVGKWIYQSDDPNDRRRLPREFSDTNLIDDTGARHPYVVEGRTIRVNWSGSENRFEQLTFDPEHPDVMHGVNHNGTSLTYKRVKN
jgi:hypothetical protein